MCFLLKEIVINLSSVFLSRKHTIQRVFANLLHETAADELTFRTVVKDLRTKCPMLQILLLNSKAWSATGYCFENSTMEPLPETDMQPVVKVLFSDLNATAGANSGCVFQKTFARSSSVSSLDLNKRLDW